MASLEDAFRPLAYRGGWSNSPSGYTAPKPSLEMGPVSMSPRQPLDPMRFNGANMVPPPGSTYADARVGPATYSQPVDMTDPAVNQITKRVLMDLDARGLLARPQEVSLPPMSVEHFSMEDAKTKLADLMGNTAFVIGVFLFIFGSVVKNAGLLIAGAVFLGVPGAMGIVKTVAHYISSNSGAISL